MKQNSRRLLSRIFFALFVYGGLAFALQAVGAWGGLGFLPNSLEWPVGYVDGVVADSAGRLVVPLDTCGRIQLYDRNREFIRGWAIASFGGDFKLRMTEQDMIEVFTMRRDKRYLFAQDGTKIEEDTYGPTLWGDVPTSPSRSMWFYTLFVLIPLSHPMIAIPLVMLAGMGCAITSRKRKKAKSPPIASPKTS